MSDQELKQKKAELRALRLEKEKLNIDAKIEKENAIIKKMREQAAEAAKSPEEKERDKKIEEAKAKEQEREERKKETAIGIITFVIGVVFISIRAIATL